MPAWARAKRGVLDHRLLEEAQALLEALQRALVPGVAALQVELVGARAGRLRPPEALPLRGGEPQAEAVGEPLRDVGLRPREIRGGGVVAAAPEARAVRHADELGVHDQVALAPHQATGEDGVHLELPARLPRVEAPVAVAEGGAAGHHAQVAHRGEVGDHALGDAVADVAQLRLPRLDVEGEHGERGHRGTVRTAARRTRPRAAARATKTAERHGEATRPAAGREADRRGRRWSAGRPPARTPAAAGAPRPRAPRRASARGPSGGSSRSPGAARGAARSWTTAGAAAGRAGWRPPSPPSWPGGRPACPRPSRRARSRGRRGRSPGPPSRRAPARATCSRASPRRRRCRSRARRPPRASSSRAIPKSRIRAWPSPVRKRFSGLRSRWTTPFACAAARPSAISCPRVAASRQGSAPRTSRSASVSPSRSSITV